MSLNQLLGNAENRPWLNIGCASVNFGGSSLNVYNISTATISFIGSDLNLNLCRIGPIVFCTINGILNAAGGPVKSTNVIPAIYHPPAPLIFTAGTIIPATGIARQLYCVLDTDGSFEFTNVEGTNTIAVANYDFVKVNVSWNAS